MAVFGVSAENSNDEITNFQMRRYTSSNKAMWHIFSFLIHERHPTVVHLAVHLENGQRVYFTTENVLQRAERPSSMTLISFFEIRQNDDFARIFLYSEMPRYYTWNQQLKKFQRRKQGQPVPSYPQVFSTDELERLYSPSQPRRVFLFAFTISQCSWPNIIPTSANC